MTQMSLQQAFIEAIKHQQAGRFREAEIMYRQILAEQPDNPDALHLLGVLASQIGQYPAAIELIQRAISVNPQSPSYYCNLGQVLLSAGQVEESILALQNALSLKPNYPEAENNLGSALQTAGKLDEAIRIFKRIVTERPTFAEAYNNLGNALRLNGMYSQAIEALQRAISLRPDYSSAYNGLGSALRADGQTKEAINVFRKALSLRQHYPEALNNLGNALNDQGDHDGAIKVLREAAAIGPGSAEVRNNLGSVYRDAGHLQEAIAWFDQALTLEPRFGDAHNNRASALQALGRLDEAVAGYRQAIECRPADDVAHVNLGITLLLRGDFEEGWSKYELRWRDKERAASIKRLGKPQWKGELIKRQRLLIHAEQGFGDTIQFIRYIPMVAQQSRAKVIVQVQPQLLRLLERFPGIDKLVEQNVRLPEFEYHCPLLSLPTLFKTRPETIPKEPMPYIEPHRKLVKRWAAQMPAKDSRRKVGLVWGGHHGHLNDKNRSMPLKALAPLGQLKQLHLFSLQKGEAADQIERAEEYGMQITDWAHDLTDFAETAGLIANLDLVITVDTAVAHLAAAMNKPVYLLLTFVPDWRWLMNRSDSPWYPSMRIFRQPKIGDWQTPMGKIVEALSGG